MNKRNAKTERKRNVQTVELAQPKPVEYRPPQAVIDARTAKPTIELGGSGSELFWGNVSEAYIPELRYPAAATHYREMLRRDPTIASADVAIKLMARGAQWKVAAAGNDEPDKKAADFLQSCMNDMSHTFEQGIEDAISCVWYGWHFNEIVYKKRMGARPARSESVPNPGASKFDDGLIGWRKFASRKQSSFWKWEIDNTGGVQGIWQTIPSTTGSGAALQRFIPIEKGLLFNARRDPGNPEGLSFLEPIYETWHFVKNLAIVQGIGFERSFTGLPVFEYLQTPSPADQSVVEQTGKALRVGAKSFVAVPSTVKFDLKDSANTAAAPLLETIKYYRTLMLQIVLAQFLSLPTNGAGSFALGRDQSALFLMIVDALLDNLASVFNRFAVPRLFGYVDFGALTDYPQITHSIVQKPNLPELSQYFGAMAPFVQPFLQDPANSIEIANQMLENAGLPKIKTPKDVPETPETGTTDEGDLAHPPARGIKFYQMRFDQAMAKFEQALEQSASNA